MKQYKCTKIVDAKPMSRFDAQDLGLVRDETDIDEPGYHVVYSHDYESWSPAKSFEEGYEEIDSKLKSDNLSFSEALDSLKIGFKVARKGWNGKGMWIAFGEGMHKVPSDALWNKYSRQHAIDNGGFADVDPYIIMKTASGSICMGWLASQADLLANDWELA